ncbi:hypothetical protein MMC28_007329 [Mycoblastus sanguinarius]|nr:hypothetical protein [Mycoblastus sanguinarius]
MIGPKDTECGQAELSVEEDLLDVLALVQPADPCITAVQGDELRPHTSRILDSSEGYVYTLIPRKDLFSLLKLLLSIEIDKPKWGDRFYTGHAPSTSPDPDILNRVTDAVLRRFTQDEESDVNWQTFKDALSVSFPHLLSQFRLIFTTFISSSPSPKVEAPNTLPSTSIFSIPHMQYLSFFYPPPAAPATVHGYTGYISPFHQFARPEAHYYLQNPKLVYSASPSTLSTIDLARILVPMRDQSILLLTGDILAASNAHGPNNPLERVTLGAYIPTPWDINGERSFKVGPAHTLFQLEPRHEHLRAQKPEAWISDLISIDTDTDTEQNRKGALRFGAKGGSGLSIDFDAGTATLKSMAVTGDSANKEENTEQDIGYQDANTAGEGPGWETRVRIDKLEVYQLDGPRAMTLQTVSELSARAETLGLFSY